MVETLGEAHDLGWKVRVRCAFGNRAGMKSIRACTQNAYLDLPTLLWTRESSRWRSPRREVEVPGLWFWRGGGDVIPPAGAPRQRKKA